jgi:hypothetical protein
VTLKKGRVLSSEKEEALDRTMWRARFERGFGPVVRQTAKGMNYGPSQNTERAGGDQKNRCTLSRPIVQAAANCFPSRTLGRVLWTTQVPSQLIPGALRLKENQQERGA